MFKYSVDLLFFKARKQEEIRETTGSSFSFVSGLRSSLEFEVDVAALFLHPAVM